MTNPMAEFFTILIYGVFGIGWLLNLVAVIQAATGSMAVSWVRLVGVAFVPLGGVIGWL